MYRMQTAMLPSYLPENDRCLGTVHLIFRGGLGFLVRAKIFFSDKIGARLFFSPALRAGLFFS